MQAALSLVKNLHSNTLHHPRNQVVVQRHGVHPGGLWRGRRACYKMPVAPPAPWTPPPHTLSPSRATVSLKFITHVFVEEGSYSRQFRIETVPDDQLQPADLNLSVQTIKQRRVTSRQSRHHIWRQTETGHSDVMLPDCACE